MSGVIEFHTRTNPRITFTDQHPRVAATPENLAELRVRYDANDTRTHFWVDLLRDRVLRAAEAPAEIYESEEYSTKAALLWYATGDQVFLDAAKTILIDQMLPAYEEELTRNAYRWAGVTLGLTADLIWNELSAAERERIVDAMLAQDEHPANDIDNISISDTDQHAANTHIHLTHALVYLGATDLPAAKLQRLETVFDKGLRQWYGRQLVKMRRAQRQYGLSGGTMDDGTDYARGTQEHWFETMWALENAGLSQSAYAQWIWNNVRTHNIYALLPHRSGLITFGDIEAVDLQADGSHTLEDGWDQEGLKLCLLTQYGWNEEASQLKQFLLDTRLGSAVSDSWALLCDHQAISTQPWESLPTAHMASGFGQVFDRTDWSDNASFFYFTAGWRSVDHNHPDVGHFSLWSNGAFVTNETPDYDIEATEHNILLIDGTQEYSPPYSRYDSYIVDTESTETYLYILADVTGAYLGHVRFEDYPFEQVTRSIFWDKLTDRLVVYDRIVGDTSVSRQQHLIGSAANQTLYDGVVGNRAEILSVVNGSAGATLHSTNNQIGVDQLVVFDRMTGELTTAQP
jgi:hypothetical protein